MPGMEWLPCAHPHQATLHLAVGLQPRQHLLPYVAALVQADKPLQPRLEGVVLLTPLGSPAPNTGENPQRLRCWLVHRWNSRKPPLELFVHGFRRKQCHSMCAEPRNGDHVHRDTLQLHHCPIPPCKPLRQAQLLAQQRGELLGAPDAMQLHPSPAFRGCKFEVLGKVMLPQPAPDELARTRGEQQLHLLRPSAQEASNVQNARLLGDKDRCHACAGFEPAQVSGAHSLEEIQAIAPPQPNPIARSPNAQRHNRLRAITPAVALACRHW
jgi:hypothetical protein